MSKIVNDTGAKPGSIYRIALKNFVTYKDVELYPGPALNLIIGPNGTGKSTFVCAIILGLCGKTSVIGRAKKISDYVRSGCEEATIELELYQQAETRNVIVTRMFNLKDVSSWYINHKTVREKQVLDLIAGFNIQVDNLCQLLPQDRVQDFSKMDPQQLLRSTLLAVGGQESIDQMEELISTRVKQRGLSTRMENNAQVLEEQIRLNERLKVTIEAMQQRQQIEKLIEICDKKKLWIEYQDLREKVTEYVNDKKEAVRLVNSHKKSVEPIEQIINKAKSGISVLEQKKLSANREIRSLQDKANETIRSVRTLEFSIKDIESSFQEKLERQRNKEMELAEERVKLDKLVTDRSRLMETVGDEDKVKLDLAELHKPIVKTNAAIDKLKKNKLEHQYDLDNNVAPQIRLYQNKLRELSDVRSKRLDCVRSYSEDAHTAVTWLRDNIQLFEKPVAEPMLLEINFKDPKFARYLESTVAARDLAAFTFESSRDMNLFLEHVRLKMGLKRVNAVCSAPGPLPRSGDVGSISYLGFYTYLLDTITAPPAILRYLCRQYNIHKIPIGNDHTYKNSGKVPPNITYFFTEKHRFTVRVSAYSGATSSSTIEIRNPRLLANTGQDDQRINCENQLAKLQQSSQEHVVKIQDIDNNLTMLEASLEKLNTSRKKIIEGVEKVRTIAAQIRMQERKIRDMENEPTLDVQQERDKCRKKQRDCALKQCRLHQELADVVKSLHNKLVHCEMWKVNLELSRKAIVDKESELRLLKDELRAAQHTLENIDRLLNRAKSDAKQKLVEAKSSCDNKLPHDPEFPYKDDFAALPGELPALHQHCTELHSRLACMEQGDLQVIAEYEEREQTIARLRNEVNNSGDINRQLNKTLETLRSKWLPSLELLLDGINRRFGEMFEKLGCAGEIKLDKDEGDEEYDRWGICVLVSFRAGEPLSRLTRTAQSGGERALATAAFLLALQAAGPVPFRCVDEINQGMDPINERKMFQLLVKVTTECEKSQYFLLTPKLLSNLEYNDKIMVHTIMNGKHIMNYRQWNYDKFIERGRCYNV